MATRDAPRGGAWRAARVYHAGPSEVRRGGSSKRLERRGCESRHRRPLPGRPPFSRRLRRRRRPRRRARRVGMELRLRRVDARRGHAVVVGRALRAGPPRGQSGPVGAGAGLVDKRLTLVTCILASIIVFLDGSVVNVALPAVREDLNAGLATQQWVVEAYLLTLGSLILAGGSYADIHGRKRSLMLGVALFAITSLACAIAPSAPFLVGARALQGVAGAVLVPASLAVLTATYDDEEERGAAVGSWTAWTGIAFIIGPLAGGTLVETLSWRGVFAINLPIAALTLWIAGRSVHESKDPEAAGAV